MARDFVPWRFSDAGQNRTASLRPSGVRETCTEAVMQGPSVFGRYPTIADEAKPGREDPAKTENHNSTLMDSLFSSA